MDNGREFDLLSIKTALVVAEVNHLLWRDRVIASSGGVAGLAESSRGSGLGGIGRCDLRSVLSDASFIAERSGIWTQLNSAHDELHGVVRRVYWASNTPDEVQSNLDLFGVKVIALSYALEEWVKECPGEFDLAGLRAGIVTCCLVETAA